MLLISIMFTAFGVLGLTFYDVLSQRLALLPLTLAPAVLYPLFTLCIFTHPYPRLWHMRRRTREEAEWPRGTAHRWSRGSRVFRTEFTTSLTTSSDAAMLYWRFCVRIVHSFYSGLHSYANCICACMCTWAMYLCMHDYELFMHAGVWATYMCLFCNAAPYLQKYTCMCGGVGIARPCMNNL